MTQRPATVSGFTLLELTIVLVVVGLVMTGLLVPLPAMVDQRRTTDTQQRLNDIREALVGFAIANGRLPCPATLASNGDESPVGGGACTNLYNGYVPGVRLGLSNVDSRGLPLDAWNNPIRYVVSGPTVSGTIYVYTTVGAMQLQGYDQLQKASAGGAAPTLYVCTSSSGITATNCGGTANTLASGVPAIVFSLGPNGNISGATSDEQANVNNDPVFVSHTRSPTPNEFDDVVTWISPVVLIARMTAAGRLP